jgi:hypothetical protein
VAPNTHCVMCFIYLRLVCLMLPVSLGCSFLIIPSVFSNVYSRPEILQMKVKDIYFTMS